MSEDFVTLSSLLEKAISEDAPITIKEGGIFKKQAGNVFQNESDYG